MSEAPRSEPARSLPEQAATKWLALLGVVAMWALMTLPHLGAAELDDEEGRRFLPAREMLASGDQILPTIFGRPYLAKPPLYYWAIELCSLPAGVVSTWSLRLPSALAVLGVALLLFFFVRTRVSAPAGTCSALVWLCTPMTVEKGTLGELEAPLALWVALALAALFAAGERRRGAATLGGLALGAAVLTKGPAAWVFLGAAAGGAAVIARGRTRRALLGSALWMLVLSTAIGAAWVALLLRRLGWEELSARWTQEVVGGGRGVAEYFAERKTYVLRAFAGLLPGSLLAFALLPRDARRGGLPVLVRFALATLVGAAAFFLVYPRSKARYLFPAAPWAALVGGYVVAQGLQGARELAAARAVRWSALALAWIGVAAGVLLLVDRFAVDFAPLALDGAGLLFALGLCGAGARGFLSARADRRAAALVCALAVAAGVRLVHATQIVAKAPHERAELARRIHTTLPPGEEVFTAFWGEFNLLALLPRRVQWTDDPGALSAGAVLFYATRSGEGAPAGVLGWERRGEWEVEKGRTLVAALAPGGA